MKNLALFTLFALVGVSALNAQTPSADAEYQNVGSHPATQTLDHYLWITKGSN